MRENVQACNALVLLAGLTHPQIVARIDEIDIVSVAERQPVQIRPDAFPTRVLTGTIVSLLPGASETPGATTHQANIGFGYEPLLVRPGMGASLAITAQVVGNALLVPRWAIRRVGRHQVARVSTGGRESEVLAVTGLSNDLKIEVFQAFERDRWWLRRGERGSLPVSPACDEPT